MTISSATDTRANTPNTQTACVKIPRDRFRLWLIALVMISTLGCGRKTAIVVPGSLSAEDSHQRMVDALAQIAARSGDENIFTGDAMARASRQRLAELPADASNLQHWLRTYQLAKAELMLGNEANAIQLFADAYALIKRNPNEVRPEILRQFYFDTAVAHLRWGETQNCCQRNSPESCILPLQGAAIHQDQEGSRKAIQWLTLLLKSTDADEPMHLATRWLLNLAYMTVGEYPSLVPKEYLLPGLDEPSAQPFPAWQNVASEMGVATFSLAGGAIADDFDNDGNIDLIVSSSDPRESLRVFWNRGDGSFEDGTQSANVRGLLGGLNIVQTDYNNDGWLDVFVMRGGWLAAGGQHPNSLLRNNGDRTFTDVTFTAGLAAKNLPTQTAAWADFDLDGDLDVYIGNESTGDLPAASQLFRNEGDGTFVDVSQQAGVTNDRLAKAVTWGDFDQDRYPDLYVSNYRGANRLYRNRGDGTFEDVATQLQVAGPDSSFPAWFCDVNNDGNLDLFVSAYSGGIAELAMSLLEKPIDAQAVLPRMYLGNAEHRFTNNAEQMGLNHPTHPMGANFGDLDGDGFVDFYLGTGWPEYHELMPNMLYRNDGGRQFVDVTHDSRMGHLQKGHAVAMADFDNDGDLDLFEQMGGFVPGDKFYDVLYRNPNNGPQATNDAANDATADRHWLKIKLVGKRSNRAAVGARLCVKFVEDGVERVVYSVVGAGGCFGANPLEQYIGLGHADRITSVNVFWPVSGATDTHMDVSLDQRIVFEEAD